jgi:hypothetical protein
MVAHASAAVERREHNRRSEPMANVVWRVMVAAAVLGGSFPRLAVAADAGQGSSPLADDRTLVALAVALACADAPEAGPAVPAPAPAAMAPAATAPADQGPELELVATVRAKALKFDVVPKTQVVFQGSGKRKTVWKTERVNLPMHPQPGVTYRDVAVRLTVTSDIEELAALLKEAKRASAGIVMEQEAPAADAAPAKGGAAPAGAAPAGAQAAPVPAAAPPAAKAPAAPPAPTAAPAPTAPTAPPAPPAPTVAPAPAPAAAPPASGSPGAPHAS